ncbi:MAG: flagellar hook assembly protein FlgD [Nitrococcus sp.]|nr:flagellar hook assembly protein FlgD [Nitrococcus sp.]
MIDLSALTGNGIGGAASASKPASSQVSQDDFLKMMVAQLQNQDPLNPMSNGEFLTQIAQFTAASGIDQLQSAFQEFQTNMQANLALQAASLVGRQVVVQSDRGYLPSDGEMSAMVHLPAAAGNLTVAVLDDAGQLVRKIELGQQPAGDTAFHWDGENAEGQPMPPGLYRLQAQTEIDGQAVSMQTRVAATVESVVLGKDQSLELNLEGVGAVGLDAVTQVK